MNCSLKLKLKKTFTSSNTNDYQHTGLKHDLNWMEQKKKKEKENMNSHITVEERINIIAPPFYK
jgi:hypothetical protein